MRTIRRICRKRRLLSADVAKMLPWVFAETTAIEAMRTMMSERNTLQKALMSQCQYKVHTFTWAEWEGQKRGSYSGWESKTQRFLFEIGRWIRAGVKNYLRSLQGEKWGWQLLKHMDKRSSLEETSCRRFETWCSKLYKSADGLELFPFIYLSITTFLYKGKKKTKVRKKMGQAQRWESGRIGLMSAVLISYENRHCVFEECSF